MPLFITIREKTINAKSDGIITDRQVSTDLLAASTAAFESAVSRKHTAPAASDAVKIITLLFFTALLLLIVIHTILVSYIYIEKAVR